jgi:nitrate reductase NapD
MNIVGILVNTLPECTARIAAQLPGLGAEVHHVSAQGQLIITIEHSQDTVVSECITQIQSLKGVLTAAMVYHQIDDPLLTEPEHKP